MKQLDLRAIGETLYTTELANGLPVFVLRKPGFRKTFAAIGTRYGGADRRFTLNGEEHDTPAGIAHYLEHKMFDMPDGSALARLEANGASPNAFTSDAMTVYHFECTDRFDDDLRELLRLVSTPYFTAESVAKEQGIIAQEIRMYEDSPDYRLYINLMRSLYDHNPLRDGVAGTVESIARITPELLYDCHRAFYRPSNMALAVVGDVDPEAVAAMAEALLPGEKQERPHVSYGAAESLEPLAGCIEEAMEVSMPQFAAGIKLGSAVTGAAALRERMTASMALKCFAGRSTGFYNRLYAEGVINDSFTPDFDSAAGEAFASFSGEANDPDAVLEAIRAELRRTSERGFDERFFARQKKASYGGRIRALGNFSGLAVSLIEGCFEGYAPLDAFSVLNSLTADECAAWLRDKLDPERLALSVIRPKD